MTFPMIYAGPAFFGIVFAVASVLVGRPRSASAARTRGVSVAIFVSVAALLLLAVPGRVLLPSHVELMPKGLLSLAPLMTALVAVVSVGLAPLGSHRPKTLARMMLLFAIGEGFVATGHAGVLTVLWSASAGVAWAELRARGGGWHRVFALYQGASVICFAMGSVVLQSGGPIGLGIVLLMLAIGVREALFPAHSWFTSFVEHAPIGVVVAFAAPQLGVYAQLEFFSHQDLGLLGGIMAVLGAATAVFAALLGVVQTHARRALAYLMLSQTGLVVFALESHSVVGRVGALLNWQVLAMATSGFAMAIALLEARRGPLLLDGPRGDFDATPRLAVAFLILGFASVGLPLTLGYVAEDLLLQGTVDEFPLLGTSMAVATSFNGINVMRAFFFLFAGWKPRRVTTSVDLSPRSAALFGIAVGALVILGVFAGPLISYEGGEAGLDRSPVVDSPRFDHG